MIERGDVIGVILGEYSENGRSYGIKRVSTKVDGPKGKSGLQ